MDSDSLVYLPMEKWGDLEKAFLDDWPRGIQAYSALVRQKELANLGLDYGFKVYCPFGDVSNGMVALNKKATFNEIIIQCPNDDTSQIEKALLSTKVIDWSKPIIVPYLPGNVLACLKKIAKEIGVDTEDDEYHQPHYLVLFSKENPCFEDVRLPEGIQFQHLSEEHIDVIDPFWPNRYDSSKWFFQLLIKSNTAYGLFKDNELVAWVAFNEIGGLVHLFTLENHRKKGYAKMLMQLVCNLSIKKKKDVFGFCRDGNDGALKLYESLGFEKCHPVQWACLLPKQSSAAQVK